MFRRPPTRRETTWAVLGLVVLVLASSYAILCWTDWDAAPVRTGLAVTFLTVGVVAFVPSVRATRADPPANLGLVDVERPARGSLRRELWAGRPGPVELRRYATGWATRWINRPGQGAGQIWLAGWLMADGASSRSAPGADVWTWVSGLLIACLVIAGLLSLLLRHQAVRVVDQLEHETVHDRTDEVPTIP